MPSQSTLRWSRTRSQIFILNLIWRLLLLENNSTLETWICSAANYSQYSAQPSLNTTPATQCSQRSWNKQYQLGILPKHPTLIYGIFNQTCWCRFWLIKLNSRIPSQLHLWNQNSWQHTNLAKCFYTCAASYGTSMFPKRQQAGYTKTTMLVQLWPMLRNQLVTPIIWTFDTTSFVNGSNGTSSSLNVSIQQLMKRITSPNYSLRSSSTDILKISWDMSHQNTCRRMTVWSANSPNLRLSWFLTLTPWKKLCQLSSETNLMTNIYWWLLGQHVYIPQTTTRLPTHIGLKLLLALVFPTIQFCIMQHQIVGGC